MNDWVNQKLGDLIQLHYGKGLPERNRMEGDTPVFSSAGLIDWHNSPLVNSEGIVIGRKGTIGSVYKTEGPFFPIDTTFYVLPNSEKYNFDFLYYYLKYLHLDELNEDSAVPGLNRDTAYDQNIYIPFLITEQKAIAEVLSSLDDKIDLLHRQNETLEALAQTLFRQWFIEEAQDDWEVKPLSEILTVKGGSTPSTKVTKYWNGDVHWATPKDLSTNDSPFLLDTERKITQLGLSKISSGLLAKGTLLLSSRAPVGYLAFAEIPLAINQGFIAIIDDKGFSNLFIYMWLKVNMDYVRSYANGSTFLEISKTAFKTLEITVPPKNKRREFENIASLLFKKIKANVYQIRNIEKLRDLLLPKLMSGEVRVRYGQDH